MGFNSAFKGLRKQLICFHENFWKPTALLLRVGPLVYSDVSDERAANILGGMN